MKICEWCGKENDEDAIRCFDCGTAEFKARIRVDAPEPSRAGPKDLVGLVNCRTLMEADMIVARLEAAGIAAFIPDQFLMQNVSWNFNTYGFVRIQVSASDYEAATQLLPAIPQASHDSSQPRDGCDPPRPIETQRYPDPNKATISTGEMVKTWGLVVTLYIWQAILVHVINGFLRTNITFRHFYQTPSGYSLFLLLLAGSMLLAACLYNRLFLKLTLADLSPRSPPSLSTLLTCAVSGAMVAIAVALVVNLFNPKLFPFRKFNFTLVATALGTPLDEIIWRGFLFVLFARRHEFFIVATIITILSLFFHIRGLYQPIILFVALFVLNIVSLRLRQKYDNLLPSICFQVGYNVIAATV